MSTWTPAQQAALHAEELLKQQMRDAGVDPAEPAEREAWEAGHAAATAGAVVILHAVRERYARAGRGDDDIFRVLENRMDPLTPGEPVQFRELGGARWFNGTYEGPVDNPDDPQRSGDVTVLSRSGRRVGVFLSSVRRRS